MTIHQAQRSAERSTSEWPGMVYVHTAAELLLGVSFIVTVVFAAIAFVSHHSSVVAEVGAVAFVCSLVAVLLDWTTAPDDDQRGWD